MRRGANGEEGGGVGEGGSQEEEASGTEGRRGEGPGRVERARPHQTTATPHLSVSGVPTRNRGEADGQTSRPETPNKQRLSHRVNVGGGGSGGDKLQSRPPSCGVANQGAEHAEERQSEGTPSRPIRGGCSSSDRKEKKHFASEREGGRGVRDGDGGGGVGGGGVMLTSSLCAVLCGHRRTESRLQQMSCGADYK